MGLRNTSGMKALDKYGEDRFSKQHKISYIMFKKGPEETSSPIYTVLHYANKRNQPYSEQVAKYATKQRKNYLSTSGYNLVINLMLLDKGEGYAPNIFEKIWANLLGYSEKLRPKYQSAMIAIGHELNIDESKIYDVLGCEIEDDSDEKEDEDDE